MLERVKRTAIALSIALLPPLAPAQTLDKYEQQAVNELACVCEKGTEQMLVYLPHERTFSNLSVRDGAMEVAIDIDRFEQIARSYPAALTLYHCHFSSTEARTEFAEKNNISIDDADRFLAIVADTPSGSDIPYSLVIMQYLRLISPKTEFRARLLNLMTNNVVEYDVTQFYNKLDHTRRMLGLTTLMHERIERGVDRLMHSYEVERWKSYDLLNNGDDLVDALHKHEVVKIKYIKRAPL